MSIGLSIPRKEGVAKVTGTARYVDDIRFPGLIFGATVRSPIPRGRLKRLEFLPGIPWDEFTVVTAKDIPGKNVVTLIESDQPYLVDKLINHAEEPIALIAHADPWLLPKALAHITVHADSLTPALHLADALAEKTIVWGRDNTLKRLLIEKGKVDSVWPQTVMTIEGEYTTEAQEQLYIECQGVIATASPAEGVTVWGSMQCPYYVKKALVPLFGLPENKVRVIQTETGGGFGGKEEYPSVIAGHAALLAWKSGRPVKLIYSRSEDMAATTKRHPSRTRIKTRVDRTGKLLSQEIDFTLDGGAYVTLSPVVLSRGAIHALGPYRCDNVRITAQALATNTPPHGAFRGFGAPQSLFAIERHMDRIAERLGLTPEELRRRNWLREGDTTATGQVIKEKVDFEALLKRAFQLSGYQKKRRRFAAENPKSKIKKGVGLATFFHGAGFTGSGERHLSSVAGVEATASGKIRVLSASTEIGQGTNTIFSQIAADALGVSPDDIEVAQPDTHDVPDSGPTVASRTCMVVGGLIEAACRQLKQTLVQSGYLKPHASRQRFLKACAQYVKDHGWLSAYHRYQSHSDIHWDDDRYQGDAYPTYAWAVYIAEVSVDTLTCEVKVDDFTAVQEVGRVIHPLLAAGQIEGGVAQGVGFALFEKVLWREGRMVNNQMTNYIMPTSADVPRIRVAFVETNRRFGPQGAKGIGELPIDGPAPAILNAVAFATGTDPKRIPLLPEDLWELCHGSR